MSKAQSAAKGPDNNRRLATLESGASALAMALAANGFPIGEGENVHEVAIKAVKAGRESLSHVSAAGQRTEQLEKQVEDLAKQLEEAKTAAPESDNATPGEIAAIARAEAAEKRIAELQEAIGNSSPSEGTEALESRIDELEREGMAKDARIKELEAGAPVVQVVADETAEDVPATAVRERPETAADVGPAYPGQFTAEELTELIINTTSGFEIAFSNGDYEIVALQRVAISAADLQRFENRHVVGPTISARLLPTDAPELLLGFGLMLEGEQIAYCAALDPIMLEPGSEHQFQRAIFF